MQMAMSEIKFISREEGFFSPRGGGGKKTNDER
jgi:hypothetical protein